MAFSLDAPITEGVTLEKRCAELRCATLRSDISKYF